MKDWHWRWLTTVVIDRMRRGTHDRADQTEHCRGCATAVSCMTRSTDSLLVPRAGLLARPGATSGLAPALCVVYAERQNQASFKSQSGPRGRPRAPARALEPDARDPVGTACMVCGRSHRFPAWPGRRFRCLHTCWRDRFWIFDTFKGQPELPSDVE